MVLDTNVALDLWYFDDPRCRALHVAIERRRILVIANDAVADELADVLTRAPFATRADTVQQAWHRWVQNAAIVRDTAAPWRCGDPDDQKFLDLAWQTAAPALITKDRALLKLGRRAALDGLWIGTPECWSVAAG